MGAVKSIFLQLLGWLVVILGIIMLAAPGPGLLGIFFGIVILSSQYRWAHRLRHRITDRVHDSVAISVATWPRVLFSLLSALFFCGLGLWVYSDPILPEWAHFTLWHWDVGPTIPYAGPLTGVIIGLSGVLALVFIAVGVLRYRPRS